MPNRTKLESGLAAVEQLISSSIVAIEPVRGEPDLRAIHFGQPVAANDLDAGDLLESLIQEYVSVHFRRLGFTAIQGPFGRGPDFRVRHGGKWALAEVERSWRHYFQHEHHRQASFAETRYLIVLAADLPPARTPGKLPETVIHIDLPHFVEWLNETRTKGQPAERLNAKVVFLAHAMHGHWLGLCPDTERDMATCPDCTSCAYFEMNFHALAIDYLASHLDRGAKSSDELFDLSAVKESDLRTFVESRTPQAISLAQLTVKRRPVATQRRARRKRGTK
ncbi:MAG: hypothetical protein KF902_05935 [Phycisphaeraceae bacterium]|nr:hypothetical protein [Phycisphaeraceae bacterium]